MYYYYADAFEEEDGSISPAAVDDQGNAVAPDIPPACQALHFDRERDPRRFVLSLDPRWPTPPPGWVPVTEAQIEADYPGLLGGA
jgi:hypothetical protein